jgi:hypothetical protein
MVVMSSTKYLKLCKAGKFATPMSPPSGVIDKTVAPPESSPVTGAYGVNFKCIIYPLSQKGGNSAGINAGIFRPRHSALFFRC